MNILITGSSTGIGAGLAKFFANKEHNICITYNQSKRNGEQVLAQLKVINPKGTYLLERLDVLDGFSIDNLANKLESVFGCLDLLVSNAGVDYDSPIEKSSFEDWHKIFHTKTDGAFMVTKGFLSLLKKSGDATVFYISASVGWKPDWNDPAYSGACAAVNSFGQSMAISLTKYGIRSNVICPGPIKTNLQYWKDVGKENKDVWQSIEKSNPLGKLCTFEDIGSLMHYISQEGKYINGNIIYLNGGAHLS